MDSSRMHLLFLPPAPLPRACAHVEIRETRSLLRSPPSVGSKLRRGARVINAVVHDQILPLTAEAKVRFLGCVSARERFANLGQRCTAQPGRERPRTSWRGHNWFHSAMFYWGTPQIGEIPVGLGLGGATAASIGLFRDSRRDPVGVPKYDVHQKG